jgi:hypothetical protein
VSSTVKEHGAVGDVTLTYGLPGKPGYSYSRPFDYFDFHVTAVTANTLESINSRGLLVGSSYASGDATRGIWGLFGSYDYISPQIFRVSTTALSLGTVWQTWIHPLIALQGTALAGAGYGAAGSIQRTEDRDYHYGATPQGLLGMRLIFGDRAMVDVTGREYYVSSVLSPENHGEENILRGDASFTLRVFGQHGIALRYLVSHRDASYPNVAFRNQTVETVSLMHVLLGNSGFGAVERRQLGDLIVALAALGLDRGRIRGLDAGFPGELAVFIEIFAVLFFHHLGETIDLAVNVALLLRGLRFLDLMLVNGLDQSQRLRIGIGCHGRCPPHR